MTVKGDLNDYARTTNYTETAPNKPEHIVQELQGQQNGQSTLEFSHLMNITIPLQWYICVYLSALISAQQESPLVAIEEISSLTSVRCSELDWQVHMTANRTLNCPLSLLHDAQVHEWMSTNALQRESHYQAWAKPHFLVVFPLATNSKFLHH